MATYKNLIVSGESVACGAMAADWMAQICSAQKWPMLILDFRAPEVPVMGVKRQVLEFLPYIKAAGYRNVTFPSVDHAYNPMFEADKKETVDRLALLLKERGQTEEAGLVRRDMKLLTNLDRLNRVYRPTEEERILYYAKPGAIYHAIQTATYKQSLSDAEAEELRTWHSECVQAGPALENLLEEYRDTLDAYVNGHKQGGCMKDVRSLRNVNPDEAYCFEVLQNMKRETKERLLRLIRLDLEYRCVEEEKPMGLMIVDDGSVSKRQVAALAEALGGNGCFTYITRDVYSFSKNKEEEHGRENLLALADEIWFSRHPRMESARAVSESLGQYWRLQKSTAVIRDRRFAQNRPLDRLFGTNRTDQQTSTPYLDFRHTKEEISEMDDFLYIMKDPRRGHVEMKVVR